MVNDARRLEPLAEEAAELLKVLGDPNRLMIVCDLISEQRTGADLQERLGLSEGDIESSLKALIGFGVIAKGADKAKKEHYRLTDIQAAEIVDALCSAFLGEDFSNRAKVPFRANRQLVGGVGKFSGANI